MRNGEKLGIALHHEAAHFRAGFWISCNAYALVLIMIDCLVHIVITEELFFLSIKFQSCIMVRIVREEGRNELTGELKL